MSLPREDGLGPIGCASSHTDPATNVTLARSNPDSGSLEVGMSEDHNGIHKDDIKEFMHVSQVGAGENGRRRHLVGRPIACELLPRMPKLLS